tara:strand:+ start:79338 stop:80456 length:1119 start_codon:yes stop_codon:yes gene_type:complete
VKDTPVASNSRKAVKYRGVVCLNCDQPLDLSDRFCPYCGQLNTTKKLSLKDFFNEFFGSIFSYDSKFRLTLSALILHPGKITKDYIAGKRTQYSNPFRFYFTVSIIFFIIWGFTSGLDEWRGNGNKSIFEYNTGFKEALKNPQKLDSLTQLYGNDEKKLDSVLKAVYLNPKKDSISATVIDLKKLDSLNIVSSTFKRYEIYNSYFEKNEQYDAKIALESVKDRNTAYHRWLYNKVIDSQSFSKNPGLFINYAVSKLPFVIFFYLPVFALFIWLLYARHNLKYMEHLIFTFHVQTIFFIIFSIALIISYITNTKWIINIAALLFIFYIYKSMRHFYGQGRTKTVFKFVIMNFIFIILAVIATALATFVAFLIY